MSLDYFGSKPKLRRLALTTGQDFKVVLRYRNEAGDVANWPSGATLKFVFADNTEWTAVVSGSLATFDIDKALCDARPNGIAYRVVYTAGTTDLVPFKGTVSRDD